MLLPVQDRRAKDRMPDQPAMQTRRGSGKTGRRDQKEAGLRRLRRLLSYISKEGNVTGRHFVREAPRADRYFDSIVGDLNEKVREHD